MGVWDRIGVTDRSAAELRRIKAECRAAAAARIGAGKARPEHMTAIYQHQLRQRVPPAEHDWPEGARRP